MQDKRKLLDFINLVREKAEMSKLVIFVGAGVSRNVDGMPSWFELIQKMAEAIKFSKCSTCSHKCKCTDECLLIEDYSTDDFLKIPQFVFNKSKKLYQKVLHDNIGDVTTDAPLSSAILDINPVHIITTNYDKLIESSSNMFCKQYQVIVNDKDLLRSNKNKYIVKMHGDISQLDTIVLKEQDYLNYSQNHILIETFLKSLLADHTILFLGYSLNDYNIKLIISWLNFMRAQNKAIYSKEEVGYIVLDEEKINKTQSDYFSGNNIGVVNINKMPLINNIPDSLSNKKGKRLYSFLRTIADQSLNRSIELIEYAVDFLAKYSYVDYIMIMKLLHIYGYEKINSRLYLNHENDFNLLEQYIRNDNENTNQFKQLFINAGIEEIIFQNPDSEKSIPTGDIWKGSLFSNELFSLYINNKYDELKSKLDNCEYSLMDKNFYQSIIHGYEEAVSNYSDISLPELPVNTLVAYLHNTAVLDAINTYNFDSSRVRHYINNITSKKERDIFSSFIELYDGNSKLQLSMKASFEKLKSEVYGKGTVYIGRTSLPEIYKIKNAAMSHYCFYFLNRVFFNGYSDAKRIFRIYIEAILCTNTEQAEKPSVLWGETYDNEKYSITNVDFDIITKFISSQDLYNLINSYKVIKLNTNKENIALLCHYFKNLCYSLVKANTYGYRQSSITTFLNLAQMLRLVSLGDEDKAIIEYSLMFLLNNNIFIETFFSIRNNDINVSASILVGLFKSLTFSPNIETIKNIVNSKNFFEYATHVNIYNLSGMIMSFAKQELPIDKQNRIKDIIDEEPSFKKKCLLLRLLYKCFTDEGIKNIYIDYLTTHFLELDVYSIVDFVIDDWIKPTKEKIDRFIRGIISISNKQLNGVRTYPDPVETRLECVYILYIREIITDISILNDLAEGRPHLQFLLSPNDFDYSQVDFSNYMWKNFARRDKYMKLFVEHKESIIPGIKVKLKDGSASEVEKKILYGFLTKGQEVWNI